MGEGVCEVDRCSLGSCSRGQAGIGGFDPLDFITRELHFILGRISIVGIAIRYELDGPGIESRWGRDFPHPSSYTMGTGSFLGVKRPGRGADHPPPSRAEVRERACSRENFFLLPWCVILKSYVIYVMKLCVCVCVCVCMGGINSSLMKFDKC